MSTLMSRIIIVVSTTAVVGGCADTYADKADDIVDVPETFANTPVAADAGQQWCTDFGDPQLQSLVEQAHGSNFSLLAGWARLRQAEAAASATDANLFPTLDYQAQASTERGAQFNPLDGGLIAAQNNSYRGSLAAAYEVDVWGRLAAQRKAAELDLRASRADAEALAISISANVAEAYFDVVAQNEQIALLEEQIGVSEKFLELTMLRLKQGSSTALDVEQQRQQLENLRGQLALANAQRETAANRLAALVGRVPNGFEPPETGELPELPEMSAGIPAQLLEQRPDLRAAKRRLEALDQRSIVAARDQLPSLRLSASTFLAAFELSSLFETVFYSLTGNVAGPLFDGGRRLNQTRAAEAQAEAALYEYGNALLTALSEVGSALVLQQRQNEFLASLETQTEAAESVLELARDRYRVGATNYLQVLTALQSLQSVQQNLVNARRQQLSYGLQLCRAVGGDWTRELEPKRHPEVEDE